MFVFEHEHVPFQSLHYRLAIQLSIVNTRDRDGFWHLTTAVLTLLNIGRADCKTLSNLHNAGKFQ